MMAAGVLCGFSWRPTAAFLSLSTRALMTLRLRVAITGRRNALACEAVIYRS